MSDATTTSSRLRAERVELAYEKRVVARDLDVAIAGGAGDGLAAFETTARARTSIPECLATIASGTVDMPTTSAPRARSMRISAGVS